MRKRDWRDEEAWLGQPQRRRLGWMLLLTLVLPVFSMSGTVMWTWDLLRAPLQGPSLFYLLTPLVGLLAFWAERLSRPRRAVTLLVLGLGPLVLLFWPLLDQGWARELGTQDEARAALLHVLATTLGALLLFACMRAGTFVAAVRPGQNVGHIAAGVAGLLLLAWNLLPVHPGEFGARQSGVIAAVHLLEIDAQPGVSRLDAVWLFLLYVLWTAATLLCASLPIERWNRPARALWARRLVLGTLAFAAATIILLPLFSVARAGGGSWLLTAVAFCLRLFGCHGLAAYGAADVMLHAVGAPPPHRAYVAAFD